MTIRLLIVDDHEVVREGLVAALSVEPDLLVVATAADAPDAIRKAIEFQPDLALVDWRLASTTGDRLCRDLKVRAPTTAVIILSTYLSEAYVRAALEAGASAYVTKSAGLDELRRTIRRVAAGPGGPASRDTSQIVEQLNLIIAERKRAGFPTAQQQRVLELAAQGLTDAQIGQAMTITISTVRFHIQNLKQLFDCHTKTELVAKALRVGAIAAGPDDG